MSQQSDYCLIGAKQGDRDPCPSGSASAPLGSLISNSGDFDWRHAVATTRTDVNHNAIYTVLDAMGRPVSLWVSWAGGWADKPNCAAGECNSLDASKLKPGQTWGKVLAYDYRVGRPIAIPTSIARVTRFADAALYKKIGDPAAAQGQISFVSDQHYDQLGRTVQSFQPSDICVLTPEGPDGATCDPNSRGTHSASGIVATDVLDRAVKTFLPISVVGLQPIDFGLDRAYRRQSHRHRLGRAGSRAQRSLARRQWLCLRLSGGERRWRLRHASHHHQRRALRAHRDGS